VLFGYRQALFAEAARTNVSQACRRFGVHRSTYYAWKREVDRSGLEMLRPRERRRPKMPNQLPKMVEERVLAFSIAHPGLGPKRVSSELRREKWDGIVVSPNGVWKVLCRHGHRSAAEVDGIEATVTAGSSSLSYDATTDQSAFVWKTGVLVAVRLRLEDRRTRR
jgi:transposase